MGKELTFDWNVFKGKGFAFQEMCADIFREHNYKVRVMEPGGSDEGRDIELYPKRDLDFSFFNDQPFAWVECKSRVTSSTPLKTAEINVNLIYAFKAEISYLIFVTNHKFNNEAHNAFQSYNRIPSSTLRIRYIEKEELEKIIKQLPKVYLKYFDITGKITDYNFATQSINIDCQAEPDSKFWDEFEGYNVKIKSSSLENQQIEIESPVGESLKLSIAPLEERHLFIGRSKQNPEKRPKLTQGATDIDNSKIGRSQDTFLSYKIDHIYVDPFELKEKAIAALIAKKNIYLAGGAGRGKSRLLKEVAKSLNTISITIDLSSDYSKSLLDYILFKILKVEKEYLKILPDETVLRHFSDTNINNEVGKIFLAYIKENSDGVDYEIVINSAAELFLAHFGKEIVFFDNVHRFSMLDFKLFEIIVKTNKSGKIVCTARSEEIVETSFKSYLKNMVDSGHFQNLDLEKVDIRSTISAFIEVASFNQESRLFLKKYQNAENFQQFVFSLKNLRAHGLLAQKQNGKLVLTELHEPISREHNYRELFEDLIKVLNKENDNSSLLDSLFLCSLYGYRFPIELIESEIKNEKAIDELIANEILCLDSSNANNSIFLRFDHELTHSIVYNSIPAFKKMKLRTKVVKFIEDLGEQSPTFSYRKLAEQFENLNNYAKAAECTNKEGRKLLTKGQLPEAYDQFERSLKFIQEFEKNDERSLHDLEANSLGNIIEIGLDHLGSNVKTYDQIRSLHVLTHMIDNDNFYEGKVYYFFAKYYFENGTTDGIIKASNNIDRAIVFFEHKHELEYAKCLNLSGVINKSLGNYELALELHNRAATIFEKNSDWEGLSEAYVDLGATYLENGQGTITFQWWLKSLQTIKKTLNMSHICNRLMDYSYIAALYQERNVDVKGELENALFMAERLKMMPNICRGHINYANYLFFSEPGHLEEVKYHIETAINLTGKHDYKYLFLLGRFSYLIFGRFDPKAFKVHYDDDIIRNLIQNYWDDQEVGDNRITNMFKFFISQKEKRVLKKVKDGSNSSLKKFVDDIRKHTVEEIERANPYFLKGVYLTYY